MVKPPKEHFELLPPHKAIEASMRMMLEQGKFSAHSAFLSELELCRHFSVNVATVRKAVRSLEMEGLLYKIHRKGTFVGPPTRNKLILLVSNERSFSTVGRLTPVSSNFPTFQWLEVPVGDLRPIVADIRHIYPRLAGVFFVRDLESVVDVMRGVQTKRIPSFFYGSDVHLPFLERTHARLYREGEMCFMAMDHLLERGCRNFGFLGTDDRHVFSARHEFFHKWMEKHGFPIKLPNVMVIPAEELFDPIRSFDAVRSRLKNRDVDADGFFCANEQCSAVFIQAVNSLRMKIPSRLKVVGIEDDGRLTEWIRPQATSVRIPFDDDIRESFRMLTKVIDQDGPVVHVASKPFLILREST